MTPVPPTLIVVAGRPGSGKTTLAHALARAVRCPVISRDEIKEGFVNATGEPGEQGDDVQRHVSDAFFDAVGAAANRCPHAGGGYIGWVPPRAGGDRRVRALVMCSGVCLFSA